MVKAYGRVSDSPDSGIFLVRLFIILLSNALIPLYWIYKNKGMKKYAKGIIPCLWTSKGTLILTNLFEINTMDSLALGKP